MNDWLGRADCPFNFEKKDNSNRITGHSKNIFTENDQCFESVVMMLKISIKVLFPSFGRRLFFESKVLYWKLIVGIAWTRETN